MFHPSSIPVTLMFLVYGAVTSWHAYKIKRRPDESVADLLPRSAFPNEVLLACLFFASGLLWPFIYINTNSTNGGVDFLYTISTLLIIGVSCLWYAQGTYNFIRLKRDKKEYHRRLEERARLIDHYRKDFQMTMSVDIKRKLLHLLPGLVIMVMQGLSYVVDGTGALAVLGVDREAFAICGEVTIAFIFVFMIHYADLLRLEDYTQLPRWAKRWFFSSITPDEMGTFVSSCALVLTLTPFLFAPFLIFVSVAFVSSLADAAASLVGRRFGKHKFPKGSSKTLEGYVAGMASAFMVVVIFAGFFNYEFIPVPSIVFMATTAALIILVIDIFSRNMSDNILNPLLTGAGMFVVFFLVV